MTRERAAMLAPVLQAYGEGKAIQWQFIRPGPWYGTLHDYHEGHLDDLFTNPVINWRIKPEPPSWWICTMCKLATFTYHQLRLSCGCSDEYIHHVVDAPKEGSKC